MGFVQKAWKSGMTGMAGNLRVASELLLRGLYVSQPFVDVGADLEVESLVRLQVKSAHVTKSAWTGLPTYTFALARGPKAQGGGLSKPSSPRVFSNHCHFVVLWGIEQNRFWIVPATLLDNRMTIFLGPEGRWIPTDSVRIREMLDTGLDQKAIAKELGVSEMTVSRRVNKMFSEPSPVVADLMRIRACEGRWDHIQSFVSTMREAERVVQPQPVVAKQPGLCA